MIQLLISNKTDYEAIPTQLLTNTKRIEANRCITRDLQHDILPSLYIDFDEKELYSMYSEPASYEDYVPTGWKAEFKNFLNLIPSNEQYWKV